MILPAVAALASLSIASSLQARNADAEQATRAPVGIMEQPCPSQDWPGLCRYRAANENLRTRQEAARIVFMGDSITEGWAEADPQFFQRGVVNRGISGQTTPQMLVRFRADVIALKPQLVHIMAGTNDVAGNTGATTAQDVKNNIVSMVELARTNAVRVVLGSIPPAAAFGWRPEIKPAAQIKVLNAWLREYATQNRLEYVDYYSALAGSSGELKAQFGDDGVHPNREGYRVMRQLLEEKIAPFIVPDTQGTGRYPALKEEVASLPDQVVYRPANLGELGATKLGVYVFGNGACANDGASSRLHLLEIASHGYVAIAPGRIRSGPGATAPATPVAPTQADGGPRVPRAATQSSDLTAAIDWALAQNADPNSAYHGKIDPSAVAISGFSCGGLQALQIAKDPRVKTLVVMNSGIFIPGSGMSIGGIEVSKALLEALHTPTLYILGGKTDIAYGNGMDDFARIDHVPVFVGNLDVGHGGTYWQPNGGKAAAAVVAWLDWQLRGDSKAARSFVGRACGLCKDPAWAVDRKSIE
jgi:lysophospholipase L1-like esterase